MLYIGLDRKPPTIEERVHIMQRHIAKGGVPVDYDRLIEYLAHSRVEQHELGLKLLSKMNSNASSFTQLVFKDWVKKTHLEKGFNLTAGGNISFNDESLVSFINTNAYGDDITDVVKLFRMYNYYSAQVLLLPNIIHNNPSGSLESEDGRRLILVKPGVEPQNTGRFGLVNPAFMNLPRYMGDLTVAPKGWKLLTADSGQIEPKVIYGFYLPDPQIQKLIEVNGDAYYAVLEYCRMPQEYITKGKMDFEKIVITEEEKGLRNKLKTYGNGVMYGSTSNREREELKQKYIERIGQHPLRIKWQEDLVAKLDAGQRIFYSKFGTPIDVYNSKKVKEAKDEEARRMALIHCIINNPVQATAGDCMGFSLQATDELMMKKAPYSWITKFTHDEGQYCIHESEVDEVMEEISGHTAYDLGGVVKIYNEPIIGRHFNKDVPVSYENLFEGEL